MPDVTVPSLKFVPIEDLESLTSSLCDKLFQYISMGKPRMTHEKEILYCLQTAYEMGWKDAKNCSFCWPRAPNER